MILFFIGQISSIFCMDFKTQPICRSFASYGSLGSLGSFSSTAHLSVCSTLCRLACLESRLWAICSTSASEQCSEWLHCISFEMALHAIAYCQNNASGVTLFSFQPQNVIFSQTKGIFVIANPNWVFPSPLLILLLLISSLFTDLPYSTSSAITGIASIAVSEERIQIMRFNLPVVSDCRRPSLTRIPFY